ncbi:MAG: cupin domain-containing protein [Chloroflexota bacterium]
MTDLASLPASLGVSEAELFGDLPSTGPRAGADVGEPQTWTRVLYDRGAINCGIWECTPGGWFISDRPNTEIVHVLRGAATITDEDGSTRSLVAGSALVLPKGWSGRWDITETIRKLYITIDGI